jgi:hypothetical protein
LTYEDDTKETFKYQAKFGEKIMILKVYATEKAIKKFL